MDEEKKSGGEPVAQAHNVPDAIGPVNDINQDKSKDINIENDETNLTLISINQQAVLTQIYCLIRQCEGGEMDAEVTMPRSCKDLGIKELLHLIRRLEYYKSQANILINSKRIMQKEPENAKELSNNQFQQQQYAQLDHNNSNEQVFQ